LNYYLLYCLSVPALLETDWILTWWLGSVPAYASLFLRLSLLEILITSFTYPLAYLNQATGNIALYQVVVGLCVLAILPLSAAALRVTGRPEAPLVVGVVIAVISLALRVAIVRRQTGFPVRLYARRALLPAAAVSALSPAAPLIIHHALPASLGRAALVLCVSLACSGVFIWFLGLTKEERTYMAALMKKIKQRETG
jgi:hypothetical protein